MASGRASPKSRLGAIEPRFVVDEREDSKPAYRVSASSEANGKHNAPVRGPGRCAFWEPDNDLLSHGQSVLSSARRRFTVLFGMGRGGAGGLWSSGVGRDGKVRQAGF